MRKAGAKDYKSYSKKILKICKIDRPSLEVFAEIFGKLTKLYKLILGEKMFM